MVTTASTKSFLSKLMEFFIDFSLLLTMTMTTTTTMMMAMSAMTATLGMEKVFEARVMVEIH